MIVSLLTVLISPLKLSDAIQTCWFKFHDFLDTRLHNKKGLMYTCTYKLVLRRVGLNKRLFPSRFQIKEIDLPGHLSLLVV